LLRSCLGPLACIQTRSSTSFVSRLGRHAHASTACGRCLWVLKLLVGCNYILVQLWNHIASDCTYCSDGMSTWTAAVNFANFVILGRLERTQTPCRSKYHKSNMARNLSNFTQVKNQSCLTYPPTRSHSRNQACGFEPGVARPRSTTSTIPVFRCLS
jgi:hypothetical protein